MASPSSSRATSPSGPLWLKALVIGMGVVIVVGFVVVAFEIVRRMSSGSVSTPPAASGATFSRSIALPSGAQVVSVEAAGERIAVHVRAADGRSSLFIVDSRSGVLLGTVDFPPGAAR